MSKPREFWGPYSDIDPRPLIFFTDKNKAEKSGMARWSESFGIHHVIEKSAYDDLQLDFDSILKESDERLVELNQERIKSKKLFMEVERLKNRDMDCTEALFSERTAWSAADKLAEALEIYADISESKWEDVKHIFKDKGVLARQALKDYRGE